MHAIPELIREYPALAAGAFILAVLSVLGVVFTVSMRQAGVSLRPLVWFFVFIGIIAVPQLIHHGLEAWRRTATTAASAEREPVEWSVVFGPSADPDLITDAKRGLSMILDDALAARLSFSAAGTSALAARFASPEAARAAVDRYRQFFGFDFVPGDRWNGWTAQRYAGSGEWNHVVGVGNELYAWTGATRAHVVAERERVLGPTAPVARSGAGSGRSIGLQIAWGACCLSIAVLWFFKGSAWAARVSAQPDLPVASVVELRQRILALNREDTPITVTRSTDGTTLTVDWRYADARWFDLMRLHKLRRATRLVLDIDDAARTVRVREYWSALDASAGAGGLSLQWHLQSGIQFFAYQRERVLGVQLAKDGTITGDLGYRYTFDLQKMKAPFIEAVTGAGWTWQPLVWNAPRWMRWLTE